MNMIPIRWRQAEAERAATIMAMPRWDFSRFVYFPFMLSPQLFTKRAMPVMVYLYAFVCIGVLPCSLRGQVDLHGF